MKRACYCKNENDKFQILHVKALRNNGYVDTEPIDIFEGKEFDNLTDLFVSANLSGYGIIGSMDDVEHTNKDKFNRKRNGLNMMNPDDL